MSNALYWLNDICELVSYEQFIEHIQWLRQQSNLTTHDYNFLLDVYAEMSEPNFYKMMRIKALLEISSERNLHLSVIEISEIRRIGEEINHNGGFEAMKICYLTMIRILMQNSRSRDLISLWNGIGEWRPSS